MADLSFFQASYCTFERLRKFSHLKGCYLLFGKRLETVPDDVLFYPEAVNDNRRKWPNHWIKTYQDGYQHIEFCQMCGKEGSDLFNTECREIG